MSARETLITKLADGRYQARVPRPDSRNYVSKRLATRAEAIRWAREQEARFAKGHKVEAQRGKRHTVGEELDQWLADTTASARAPRTPVVRRTNLARVPAWLRALPLGDLAVSHCERWQGELLATGGPRGKGYNPRTVRQTVGTFAQALEPAVIDGRIPKNPARYTSTVHLPREEVREAMPVEAIVAIREAMDAEHRIVMDLAYGAGLRLGEACGVTLERVDFLRRRLRVEKQWTPYARTETPGRGGARTRYGWGDPKHGSKRWVPVPESLLVAINAHVAEHGVSTEGTLARTSKAGKPMTEAQWHDEWTAAAQRAGVSASWTLHDLRHAYGSRHLAAGTPLATVAEWMGDTKETVLRTYAHGEADAVPMVDLLAHEPAPRMRRAR